MGSMLRRGKRHAQTCGPARAASRSLPGPAERKDLEDRAADDSRSGRLPGFIAWARGGCLASDIGTGKEKLRPAVNLSGGTRTPVPGEGRENSTRSRPWIAGALAQFK